MGVKILRLAEISERTGIPRETLRSYRARGLGPKTGILGGRVVALESDVDAWISEQLAATSSTKPAA